MNNGQEPTEAEGLPAQRPAFRLRCADGLPENFVPLLLVLQPSGTVLEVDRPDMVIGRHTDADVRLPLPDVSRRHCRLLCTDGVWQVIDLNSLNGTHVNGEQVLQATLENGDQLRLGGFTFVVDLPTDAGRGEVGTAGSGGHMESIVKTLAIHPQQHQQQHPTHQQPHRRAS